jgi:hypothetical protein
MYKFNEYNSMSDMSYGLPSKPHIDAVQRDMKNSSSALGRFLERGMRSPLPPFPPNYSSDTIEELNYIISRMAESQDWEREYAIRMDSPSNYYKEWADVATYEAGLYGSGSKQYSPEWFKDISIQVEGLIDYLKILYSRPRPSQLAPAIDKKIEPILPDPETSAYPSGHAIDSWVFATILSRLHPRSASRFEELAGNISDTRVVGGVHYPSDLVAGRMVAEYIVNNDLVSIPQ